MAIPTTASNPAFHVSASSLVLYDAVLAANLDEVVARMAPDVYGYADLSLRGDPPIRSTSRPAYSRARGDGPRSRRELLELGRRARTRLVGPETIPIGEARRLTRTGTVDELVALIRAFAECRKTLT
jgi:hypothetical protein